MFKEFKDFAMRGGLIDIAVGLVLAAAFGTIVSSFVDGMFMPLVSKIFQIVLDQAVLGADGKVATPENAIFYGSFISSIINFIIIAFVMFLIVKAVNSTKKSEVAAPAGPSSEQLLTEIRDLLAKK